MPDGKGHNTPAVKVLVLTSRTGGGHDARAEAFQEWIARLYGAAVAVRIDHTLENSSPWYAFGVNLYNVIQRRLPFIHHLYYHLGELFGLFQRNKVRVGLDYFDHLLREFQPDVILSVHSILNRGYFRHAKAVLPKPVRCVTYCGEFRGSYGFSHNWVAPETDLFLGRTPDTLRSAGKVGLPAERGRSLGHLLSPPFYQPRLDEAAKAAYLSELGLAPARFTLLIATGGAGAQNHIAFLRQLLPFAERIQVIALSGRSTRCAEALRAWGRDHTQLGLAVVPFTKEMHRLLQVAGAVVARPGTTTSAEALQLGCPILFNRLGGTMPQEFCTLRYFRARELSPEVRKPADLVRILAPWLADAASYRRYLERFQAARTIDEPKALIKAILGPHVSAADRTERNGIANLSARLRRGAPRAEPETEPRADVTQGPSR